RLFDKKNYFTIYDFVNAHNHFQDPEWDGEPLEPEPYMPRPPKDPKQGGVQEPPPTYCEVCENDPCVCDHPPRQIIKIKLADNKVREIDSMVKTTFWSPDGTPISHTEFINRLFGDIPSLFNDEAALRKIWSIPETRRKLLDELSEKGYTHAQLEELKKLVHGEDSDLYDVLKYIAYSSSLVSRQIRAERARIHFDSYNPKQQEFLNFVLDQYVKQGFEELDDSKLPDLLQLKYRAISDAREELGDVASIRETFIGFQEYLYGEGA
ncbi:MAG: type I restriction-modification enzyme R subunit C-terminal domain-containing protein, partial [Marinoscillum sp.]